MIWALTAAQPFLHNSFFDICFLILFCHLNINRNRHHKNQIGNQHNDNIFQIIGEDPSRSNGELRTGQLGQHEGLGACQGLCGR